MADNQDWRAIVASSLDWEQAHAGLDSSIANVPPELRGKRPDGLPHSVWEQLYHIRYTLHDLLDFCINDKYHEPKWPDDYWPASPAPANDDEWQDTIDAIHLHNAAFAAFTMEKDRDLTAKIPHGTGQTYLRTVLVAMDHASYHVAQIVLTRRLLGDWPPKK